MLWIQLVVVFISEIVDILVIFHDLHVRLWFSPFRVVEDVLGGPLVSVVFFVEVNIHLGQIDNQFTSLAHTKNESIPDYLNGFLNSLRARLLFQDLFTKIFEISLVREKRGSIASLVND